MFKPDTLCIGTEWNKTMMALKLLCYFLPFNCLATTSWLLKFEIQITFFIVIGWLLEIVI